MGRNQSNPQVVTAPAASSFWVGMFPGKRKKSTLFAGFLAPQREDGCSRYNPPMAIDSAETNEPTAIVFYLSSVFGYDGLPSPSIDVAFDGLEVRRTDITNPKIKVRQSTGCGFYWVVSPS